MKFLLAFILLLLAGSASADFETWTRKDGERAVMNLIEVEQTSGRRIARFELRNGTSYEMPVSDLSPASQRRLESLAEFRRPRDTSAPLYRTKGKDAPFRELIQSGQLKPGRNRLAGVRGSDVRINRSLVESNSSAQRGIARRIRIHTLAHSAINRDRFDQWSRWYQEEHNTQIFRLFKGEANVRNSRPLAARIEAFSELGWKAGQGWHEWTGSFTIVKPHPAMIFQVKNQHNDWAVSLGMDGTGKVSVNHRRGPREVVGRNLTGVPFEVRVRDNGHDYQVWLEGNQVASGSFARPRGETNFRWGLYLGANPVRHDIMIFVSGATFHKE